MQSELKLITTPPVPPKPIPAYAATKSIAWLFYIMPLAAKNRKAPVIILSFLCFMLALGPAAYLITVLNISYFVILPIAVVLGLGFNYFLYICYVESPSEIIWQELKLRMDYLSIHQNQRAVYDLFCQSWDNARRKNDVLKLAINWVNAGLSGDRVSQQRTLSNLKKITK